MDLDLDRFRADMERALVAFASVPFPVIVLDISPITPRPDLAALIRKLRANIDAADARAVDTPRLVERTFEMRVPAAALEVRDTGRQNARRLPQRRAATRGC
jgi:hypothetical protein